MLVRLPQSDASCLHILGSVNAAITVVPTSRVDVVGPVKKLSEQKMAENPNTKLKRNGRIYRKSPNGRGGFVRPSLEDQSSVETTKSGRRKNGGICGDIENEKGTETRSERECRNFEGKGKKNCLLRRVSYGGDIPLILRALDTISNLDAALKPWERSVNNKERSIILKEQTNWERALEIFEWFKRKGCHELNVIHYNILFRILGKALRWNHVESLWHEMEIKTIVPTNSTYGTLIDVYSKAGLMEEAHSWLNKMCKQGLQPDEVTVGIVIQMYKKAGQFGKADQFFKRWLLINSGGEKHLSLSTYNTLIDTYGKAGQLKEASDAFAEMVREGIVPNTVTFNTMIHISGNHGHMEEVAALMKKMEDLHCSPDTRTYNILISLHAKYDKINEATEYFRKLRAVGLEPDVVSYRTLLYAFSIRRMVREAEVLVLEMDEQGLEIDEYTQSSLTRMYVDAGMLERSWSWFERFHVKGKMNSECYSANIDAYGEHGHTLEAEKVFHCCRELMRLTVMEFNVMIKAYGIGKEYDKACDLFDDMEKYGISPDRCTYNSIIQILSGAELPLRAKRYVRKMQEAGLVGNCVPYCAVMSSFVKLSQVKMAEDLFKEMVHYRVQPDIVAFGILINAFADIGSVEEAIAYFKAMKTAGFSGNSIIYNSLIKLYTKVGFFQEAQETYNLLRLLDDGPDVYSSNCMIDLYSERSMIAQAEEIFKYLKQRGQANEFSFAMMLCMYKKNGKFDQAFGIAHDMNEQGLLTDVLSYNNIIGLYTLDGRLREAVQIFHRMVDLGIQPDDSTYRSLGVLLKRSGVSKGAIHRLELARRKDAESGLDAWMMTLYSMVGVGADVALKTW